MKFEKMHCNGNDFIIIEDNGLNYSDLAIRLCDVHLGVGASGLIVVKNNPLEMVCYYADGTLDYSNNGIFCFVRYCLEHLIVKADIFSVYTKTGIIGVEITSKNPFMCKVNLGKPSFVNQMLHISDNISCFGRIINVLDYRVTVYSLYLGGINTVIFVDSLEVSLTDIALEISKHKMFKRGTNVIYACVNKQNISIKCYDIKRGYISSSISLAAASMVAASKLALCKSKAKVDTKYGDFTVEYKKEICFITGTATKVFSGILEEVILC